MRPGETGVGTRSSGLRIRLLFRVLKRRREDGKSHSSSDRERSKGNPGHVALPFRGSPSTHSAPIWFREESFIFGEVRIEASEAKHLVIGRDALSGLSITRPRRFNLSEVSTISIRGDLSVQP